MDIPVTNLKGLVSRSSDMIVIAMRISRVGSCRESVGKSIGRRSWYGSSEVVDLKLRLLAAASPR
jgi:hypothetical protein